MTSWTISTERLFEEFPPPKVWLHTTHVGTCPGGGWQHGRRCVGRRGGLPHAVGDLISKWTIPGRNHLFGNFTSQVAWYHIDPYCTNPLGVNNCLVYLINQRSASPLKSTGHVSLSLTSIWVCCRASSAHVAVIIEFDQWGFDHCQWPVGNRCGAVVEHSEDLQRQHSECCATLPTLLGLSLQDITRQVTVESMIEQLWINWTWFDAAAGQDRLIGCWFMLFLAATASPSRTF